MGTGGGLYSKLAVLLILIVGLWVQLNHAKWNRVADDIRYDVACYYMYLPAIFVQNDLYLDKFVREAEHDHESTYCVSVAPTGYRVMKFSSGMAIMYAPFYLMAHILAPLNGFEQNGYNSFYSQWIHLGVLVYLFVGLWALMLLLRRYFTDKVTAFTLLVITLGTNLFYYMTLEPNMSHAYSFSLIAVALWSMMKWHDRPTWLRSLGLGLLLGLIALIRPTNILLLLPLALYGVLSLSDMGDRLAKAWQYKWQLIWMGCCFLLPWIPQMIYWKTMTGSWMFYSYRDEGFNFLAPHIMDGLFSYRKGWLLYTPVMLFGLLGIPLLFRYAKQWAITVSLFVPINIYIIFSWWCWWYGGSLGQRPMIDSYAIMAIPMAAFISYLVNKGRTAAIVTTLVFTLLIGHSLFQTAQRNYEAILWDGMTKEAYWDSFLRLKPSDHFKDLVDPPL